MLKHVRNAALAVVGEVNRIDDAPQGGIVWPALLVLSVAVSFWLPGGAQVGASQIMWCLLIPLLARIARREALNLRRFCIVAVSTGFFGYAIAWAGVPAAIIWTYMFLAGVFAFRAVFSSGELRAVAPTGFPDQVQALDESALRALRARPGVSFRETGPTIATYLGADVPAYFIDARGERHVFVCTCPDPGQRSLREGESLVSPGLIYELDRNEPASNLH